MQFIYLHLLYSYCVQLFVIAILTVFLVLHCEAIQTATDTNLLLILTLKLQFIY